MKRHVKQGDSVRILSGAAKGKTGKVLRILPKTDRVVVEGVNVVKRHQKARKTGSKGQIIEKTLSIHSSNVMRADAPKKKAAKKK